jgi:protein-S-isoprenylcysteine O-methyltransferase Ste14
MPISISPIQFRYGSTGIYLGEEYSLMMKETSAGLIRTILLRFLEGLIVVALCLFVPAGSLSYWQGWLYLGVLFVPLIFVGSYFLKRDPGFLERRMRMREKEAVQGRIQAISGIIFFAGFLIPGLDFRFGWSQVPVALVLAADVAVFLGYLFIFRVFRENSYAARTVEVEAGQRVVSTGPYALVRHPMYLGVTVMFLATPLALGSWWALPVFLLLPPFLVLRIRNEEDVLLRELPGYPEYCRKVRYRLIPRVW